MMIPRISELMRRHDGARTPESHTLTLESRTPESRWFWEHYDIAANQILEAFQAAGVMLDGKAVADVGCGDGFMDLGVLHKARPRKLVGYDVNLTNKEHLRRRAGEEGIDATSLNGLDFEQSTTSSIPAEDSSFDCAFSWSAFEHISRPVEVLTEIHRILSPDGVFFLQLWPFYFSAKGSHLWEWFPEDYHHLQRPEPDVVEELRASDTKARDWTEIMSGEFERLNRITVDELQRSMLASGFVVRRVELLTGAVGITPELARYSWLDLAIGGIKLIATTG
jgi:ubiquinone/menaquinone biosynthesis C-methylase UbiE